MFTTGSKLLIGAAVARRPSPPSSTASPRSGTLGTIGLICAAVALAVPRRDQHLRPRRQRLGDGQPTPLTAVGRRPRPAPAASMWPLVGALGGVLVVVGLVTYPVVFIFGLIVCSPRPSSGWCRPGASGPRPTRPTTPRSAAHRPPARVPDARRRSASAIIIYSFSRIMLFLSKTGGPVAVRRHRRARPARRLRRRLPAVDPQTGAIAGVCSIAALGARSPAVPAPRSTASATIAPPRDDRRRSPPTASATTADETEADENASQSVAAKANITAELTLREDGTLVADDARASTGDAGRSSSPARNPTNVMFRNDSERGAPARARPRHPARGRRGHGDTIPTRPRSRPAVHAARRGRRQPVHDVLDHGRQLRPPTSPYAFTVPGVDGAESRWWCP